jgi:glucoamylase
MGALQYSIVKPAMAQSRLTTIAQYMFWLMFRNVALDGFVFEDPVNVGVLSRPGCVLASPWWDKTAHVSQDYVYNWTRDAAVVAIELAHGSPPTNQPLIDYVQFAQICQNSASAFGHFDRASFLIDGTPRDWSDQTDGPALQTLAILQLFPQLDAPTQAVASAVIAANLHFLEGAYQGETVNLWRKSPAPRSSPAPCSCSAFRRSRPTTSGSRSQRGSATPSRGCRTPFRINGTVSTTNRCSPSLPRPTTESPTTPTSTS